MRAAYAPPAADSVKAAIIAARIATLSGITSSTPSARMRTSGIVTSTSGQSWISNPPISERLGIRSSVIDVASTRE